VPKYRVTTDQGTYEVTTDEPQTPYQPRNVLAEGRASAATSGQPEAQSGFQDWFNNELKPVLEKVARPETIADIASLLVPDAAGVVTGARAAARAAGSGAETVGKGLEALGASRLAQRIGTYGAGYAALSGNLGKAAIAAGSPPAATAAGKVLQSGGRFMQELGARPVAEAAPVIAETPTELTARLTAENAAAHGNVKPDLAATLEARPAAPQAQAPTPAPVASPTPAGPASVAPEAAPQTVRVYHGSTSARPTLQPGTMMTTDPAWAAGYATHDVGGIGPEEFTGKVHAADVPIPEKTLTVKTLHGAESQLIDLAKTALGRQPTTLQEAAQIVREKYGYEAIVAKGADGTVTGMIPLGETPVSAHLDPSQVVKQAMANGQPVADNLQAIIKRMPEAAPMSTPEAFKAALNAFDTAKVAPQAAEVNNAAMLIKRGVAPDEALQKVLSNRPPAPANPAAELAKRLGTPSEAEMNADMAARARRGQKSLMPKYGGEPAPTPQATLAQPVAPEAPPVAPTPAPEPIAAAPEPTPTLEPASAPAAKPKRAVKAKATVVDTPPAAADTPAAAAERVIDVAGAKTGKDVQGRVISALTEELANAQQAAKFSTIEFSPSAGKTYGYGRVMMDGQPVAAVDKYGKINWLDDSPAYTTAQGKRVAAESTHANISLEGRMDEKTPGQIAREATAKVAQAVGQENGAGMLRVQIPGDGTFTVPRNPHAIGELIRRLSAGGPSIWQGVGDVKFSAPKIGPEIPKATW
jgi:hypothetical protein